MSWERVLAGMAAVLWSSIVWILIFFRRALQMPWFPSSQIDCISPMYSHVIYLCGQVGPRNYILSCMEINTNIFPPRAVDLHLTGKWRSAWWIISTITRAITKSIPWDRFVNEGLRRSCSTATNLAINQGVLVSSFSRAPDRSSFKP